MVNTAGISTNLIKTFIKLGLIDIYKISVHPVALGSGKPLFEDLRERLELKLTDSKNFKSGVAELHTNLKGIINKTGES